MATRRLTDAFLLLRNNSIQNRQLLAEQLADDRMALVSGISLDPEAAIGVTKRSPPKWVDAVDEIQYDVGRIKQKMKELASLHDQHLNRPTLDDSSEQEHAIEITTQEITQVRWTPGDMGVYFPAFSQAPQRPHCATTPNQMARQP